MGLQVEKLDESKERRPVAGSVPAADQEWLQTHRIELNTMSTPVFLEWLDRKISPYNNGKVIPPEEVLIEQLHEAAREHIRATNIERILAEADLDGQVEAA